MRVGLVGSEMYIRDSPRPHPHPLSLSLAPSPLAPSPPLFHSLTDFRFCLQVCRACYTCCRWDRRGFSGTVTEWDSKPGTPWHKTSPTLPSLERMERELVSLLVSVPQQKPARGSPAGPKLGETVACAAVHLSASPMLLATALRRLHSDLGDSFSDGLWPAMKVIYCR